MDEEKEKEKDKEENLGYPFFGTKAYDEYKKTHETVEWRNDRERLQMIFDYSKKSGDLIKLDGKWKCIWGRDPSGKWDRDRAKERAEDDAKARAEDDAKEKERIIQKSKNGQGENN